MGPGPEQTFGVGAYGGREGGWTKERREEERKERMKEGKREEREENRVSQLSFIPSATGLRVAHGMV